MSVVVRDPWKEAKLCLNSHLFEPFFGIELVLRQAVMTASVALYAVVLVVFRHKNGKRLSQVTQMGKGL